MTEAMTQENDWFDDDYDEHMSAFEVTDDQTAEWCLSKIREADAEMQKWADHYNGLMQKITEAHDRTVSRMQMYLRQYLRKMESQNLVKSTKTKTSYALPSGTLTIKKASWKYERDEAALVDWMTENAPDLIKTQIVRKPDWASLKKETTTMSDGSVVLTETGEVVGGVVAIMGEDEFSIS